MAHYLVIGGTLLWRGRVPRQTLPAPAWATALPFADGSFDMAIDVCGPVMYVPDEELAQYQQELIRVTKPDALIFSSNARRLCKNLEILT